MRCHLCHISLTFALFAAPVCCPAAGMVRTAAELVAAVENGKEGDTIELAAGAFELGRTLELKAGMVLKGAGMDQTTITHAESWKPATLSLPDPEMRLEGLDTDAYLIRIGRDTSGVTISDMTLLGPQVHGAIFAWFHTGLHLHHLRIKDTLWCGIRTFGMKEAKIHDCEFVNAGGRWEKGKPGLKGGITGGGIFACWMADTEIWNNRFLETRKQPHEHYYGIKVRQAKRVRVHHNIIARTTKEPRTEGLFGFNDKSGFPEFRFTDNIIECEGTPRPLFRNDASGAARVENNKLVNITDTARYPNKATGKPQGPEQPLKFECGVDGEMTVDGWKTRKTVAR